MKQNYKLTMYACYISYIIQAAINNYVPLLFVTFQTEYNMPLSKITVLITLNFIVQLIIAASSALFIDKISYRLSTTLAHLLSALGFIFLAVLPDVFADPFVGFVISVCTYASGSGLIEVIVNPTIEACPSENKERSMATLHSFYCWGQAGIVLLSTLFFSVFGTLNWRVLTVIWAIIPAANIFIFAKAPAYTLHSNNEKGMSIKELFSIKAFWLLMILIICSGASEQSVAQWASTFAEQELGVSKTIGDLAGPMAFALLMGTSRLIYSRYGDRLDMDRYMRISSILCIISYMLIVLVPIPMFSLIGCSLCGFSVGIFHPGTYSKSFSVIKGGGAMMFSFIALGGYLGSSVGPAISGFVSSGFNDNMKAGIAAAMIFPIIMLTGNILLTKISKKN
jgi:fucose permease